jgi:hypothetical protein
VDDEPLALLLTGSEAGRSPAHHESRSALFSAAGDRPPASMKSDHLGRGVTVARLALDQLVQVRILAAQLNSTTMSSHSMAVGTNDIALLDLIPQLFLRAACQRVPSDVEALGTGPMVKVHHEGWIPNAAIGAGSILGFRNDAS